MALGRHGQLQCFALFAAVARLQQALGFGEDNHDAPVDEEMAKYSPKSCKYNLLPTHLESRAYTTFTGEVQVNDVFGLPSALKRHGMLLKVKTASMLTLQAEVHRDTPATLSVDLYDGKTRIDSLVNEKMLGAGGDDTKVFIHGLLGKEKELDVHIYFTMVSVEVAAAQVDSRVAEARCWPIRLDLAVIPSKRAPMHWAEQCPDKSRMPPPLGKNGVSQLPDDGFKLEPSVHSLGEGHYVYRFGWERPFKGFGRALWSGLIEVGPRLHRFVRLFFRASFRFASSPLQLVVELFDLKDNPDSTDLAPRCVLGCLGGVPVFNGQIINHAMPTGFRYRLWLLRAGMDEWMQEVPSGRHCIEFDFDYSIKFEEGMTPFEVGPSAWLCESTRLPSTLIQTKDSHRHEEIGDGEAVIGRNIWIRDRFGFPPDEVSDMEHRVIVQVQERSVFRATTHHSDGVDVYLRLDSKDGKQSACRSVKHPGPVPRQTVFCILEPGEYHLTFFADYPLGGLHPCSDFFAQMALKPIALLGDVDACVREGDVHSASTLTMSEQPQLHMEPNWQNVKVPIEVGRTSRIVQVWRQGLEVKDDVAAQKVFLRMVVYSDYASADMRFQVWLDGRWIADTQVTASGYADMIGPLDAGVYEVRLYYVSAGGLKDDKAADNPKLCSAVSADLRLVSKVAYENNTENWLCTSTRVPAPASLEPQSDEQVLIDSEYVMPENVAHSIKIVIKETRTLRVQATSADADFLLKIRSQEKTQQISTSTTTMEVVLAPGNYLLLIIARVKNLGNAAACSTFLLNLLLQSDHAIPQCPWSSAFTGPRSSRETTQQQASDHIGNLLLDLVPSELSSDTRANVKKPVSLWMSEGMEKTFDFKVSETSAIRLDIAMHPPILPLQVTVANKVVKTKLEAPISTAEWTENRLLLINSDLAPGSYVLAIKQPKKYVLGPGVQSFDMRSMCSHVTISAELGSASKEAINSMRSELLDLPDLLAVQPWLPSLNMVGWLSAGSFTAPIVGTQVYRFQSEVTASKFKLDEKSIVRVVCEPADLSNSEIDAKLKKDGSIVASSDNLGQLIAEADPGSYELEMRPKAGAPFLVTVGVATESRLREDIVFNADQDACSKTVPAISAGERFPKSGWTIGPVFVRLDPKFLKQEGVLSKVPIVLAAPSVLYIELGSALPLDLVRISLEVPEGLWVAEQRGLRNSLEIELPSGQYTVHLGQPKAARLPHIQRCLDFSVLISAKPISPDSSADEKADESNEAAKAGAGSGSSAELVAREEAAVEAAPCFSMGTVPMPLDLSDPKGGSPLLGGPIKDGRLLVRSKVLITDMHDGRKKMYIATDGKPLQMKVGVLLGGYSKLSLASSLSFRVTSSTGKEIKQLIHWATDGGWERVFVLDSGDKGYWLAFHHSHRERAESACLHFTLAIETHPLDELQRMMTCPSSFSRAQDKIPNSFDIASLQSSASPFRFKSPMWSCKQPQDGFLTKSKFTLTTQSWVSAEVGFNFFISHGEMDLVEQQNSQNPSSIAFGEFDFVHNGGHQLNSRLVLGRVLPPGDYMIRVADDHYEKQLDKLSGSACFPFSFEILIVPEKAVPTVVSVQPDPTVPVHRGTDLVLTLRFSEPPAGTIEDVISCMWLGPYQAKVGGSFHHLHSKYASAQHVTTVQASAAEGHHVWVIAWSADVVKELSTATLRIVGLKSNFTKQLFRFNQPTFIVSEAGHVEPWSGGDKQGAGEPMAPGTPADGPSPLPAAGSSGSSGSSGGSRTVGAPRPEGGAASASGSGDSSSSASSSNSGGSFWGGSSRTVGTVGVPRHEGSSSGSSSGSGATGDFPGLPQWEPKPNVEEWNPFGDDSKPSGKKEEEGCPEGTTLNKETSICETSVSGARSLLSDSRVTTGAFAFSAIFLVAFCWPSIRKMVPSPGSGKGMPHTRFRDIGERTEAEELGLVGHQDYDDDDML